MKTRPCADGGNHAWGFGLNPTCSKCGIEINKATMTISERLKEAEQRGFQRAIEQMRAAIKREQNYREFREDQDGSGVGACKEILGYLTALENTEKQK